MRLRHVVAIGLLSCAVGACQVLLGIEDRSAAPEDAGAGDEGNDADVPDADRGDAGSDALPPIEAGCPDGSVGCSGKCVQLTSDPTSCGACGHACLGDAGCEAGLCEPEVVFFAGNATTQGHFAANVFYFVISVDTRVAVYDRAQQATYLKNYQRAEGEDDALAANAVALYSSRRSAATPGVTRTTFAEETSILVKNGLGGTPLFMGLRLIGDRAYFTHVDELYGAQDGSPATLLTTIPGLTTAIAADGDDVFAGDATGTIYRVPKLGGDPIAIGTGPADPAVADAWKGKAKVVWATRTSVVLVDTTNGAQQKLLDGATWISDVRVSEDGFAYVLDRGAAVGIDGTLTRVSLVTPSAPPLVLLRGVSSPRDLYLEGPYAFTLDRDTPSQPLRLVRVMRIAR